MLSKSAYKKAGPDQVLERPGRDNPASMSLYIGAVRYHIDLCAHGVANSKITNMEDRRPRSIGEQVLMIASLVRETIAKDDRSYSRFAERSSVNIGGIDYSLSSVVNATTASGAYRDLHSELAMVSEAVKGDGEVDKSSERALKENALKMVTHTKSMETLYLMIHNPEAAARLADFTQDGGMNVVHYTNDSIPTGSGIVGYGRSAVKTMFLGAGSTTPAGYVQAVSIHTGTPASAQEAATNAEAINIRTGASIMNAMPALNELQLQMGPRMDGLFVTPEESRAINTARHRMQTELKDIDSKPYARFANELMRQVGENYNEVATERVADLAMENQVESSSPSM